MVDLDTIRWADRADHWLTSDVVPRSLTLYEAGRLYESYQDQGRCTWCGFRRIVRSHLLHCTKCDAG